MTAHVRPQRLSWRTSKRGSLLPTHGYELPPIATAQYVYPNREHNPGSSTIPIQPYAVTLPRISVQQASYAKINAALAARGLRA